MSGSSANFSTYRTLFEKTRALDYTFRKRLGTQLWHRRSRLVRLEKTCENLQAERLLVIKGINLSNFNQKEFDNPIPALRFSPVNLSVRTFCSSPSSRNSSDAKMIFKKTNNDESVSSPRSRSEIDFNVEHPRLHERGDMPSLASFHTSSLTSHKKLPLPFSEENLSESEFRPMLDPFLQRFLTNTTSTRSSSSADGVEVELSNCTDINSVYEVLECNIDRLTIHTACSAITKLYSLVGYGLIDSSSITRSTIGPVDVPNHRVMEKLTQVLENNLHCLDDASIARLLVHVSCLSLPNNSMLVHKMLQRLVAHADQLDLESLTRILVPLRSPELNYFVKGKFMPRLMQLLNICKSKEDYLLINYCITNSRKLLPLSFASLHSKKVMELLDLGVIRAEDHGILIGLVQLIIFTGCPFAYHDLLGRVTSLLASRTTHLETNEIIELCAYCQLNKLDRHLMVNLYRQAALAMSTESDPLIQGNLFLCLSPECAQTLKSDIVEVVKKLLDAPLSNAHMRVVYLILRSRIIDDFDIINRFWDKVLSGLEEILARDEIFKDDALGRDAAIAQVQQRYLYFNQNLGGQYRHKAFEQRIIELINGQMHSVAGSIVGRMVRMGSFVLAYSDAGALPAPLVASLLSVAPRLNVKDLQLLTRGLQVSQAFNRGCYNVGYVSKMTSLAHALAACCHRLALKSSSLQDLIRVTRASAIVDELFSKYSDHVLTNPLTNSLSWTKGIIPTPLSPYTFNPIDHPAKSLTSPYTLNSTNPSVKPSSSSQFSGVSTQPHLTPHPNDTIYSSPQPPVFSEGSNLNSYVTAESVTLSKVTPIVAQHLYELTTKDAFITAQTYARSKFYNVQVLDAVLLLLYQDRARVQGLTVGQALHSTFMLGHAPPLPLQAMRALSSVVAGDLSSMHGLQLLNAVVALSFYQSLTAPLIRKVFNVAFMDLLDREMQTCMSKTFYPRQVRRLLMEVNRSVCIDHPETRVPWFHDQYCSDHMQTACHRHDGFSGEVRDVLSRVLGGKSCFSPNLYSPYYYHMDFSFVLDDKGNAVPPAEQPSPLHPRTPAVLTPLPPGYSRHCILLHNKSHFVQRQSTDDAGTMTIAGQLNGEQQMKQRHLEVLGYDVINVSRHEWQAMALSTNNSKQAYLNDKIYSGRR
ncbi:uncharacterized protein LOC108674121 [Hyalella azteca]|uniref:Uncharacterized protein LOC108674121 n=1 Tax=Hyalella azteca TaxID=294128 RepID=A0A8B7NUV7_HYAAZ|nr:uncharacterized protein LOC108674121 [Hyalella azteca]